MTVKEKDLGMTGCERRRRIKNKKREYKSINGAYVKFFVMLSEPKHLAEELPPLCHVEPAETSRGSVA